MLSFIFSFTGIILTFLIKTDDKEIVRLTSDLRRSIISDLANPSNITYSNDVLRSIFLLRRTGFFSKNTAFLMRVIMLNEPNRRSEIEKASSRLSEIFARKIASSQLDPSIGARRNIYTYTQKEIQKNFIDVVCAIWFREASMRQDAKANQLILINNYPYTFDYLCKLCQIALLLVCLISGTILVNPTILFSRITLRSAITFFLFASLLIMLLYIHTLLFINLHYN